MNMRLNSLSPQVGSRATAKRVGRGIGCGNGKTCGRGHKGQKSRTGGYHKTGFEGGQMPLQRRLPKVGFSSRTASTVAQIRLQELEKIVAEVIDLDALLASNLISKAIKRARIIDSGKITKAVSIRGLGVTKGARIAIETAGGRILED